MTTNLLLAAYASLGRTAPGNCDVQGVRAFKSSPFRVNLQVRSRTAKTGYYSTAELTASQCRELAQFLNDAAELLTDETSDHTHAMHCGREMTDEEKSDQYWKTNT